jgi:hypothetical protein
MGGNKMLMKLASRKNFWRKMVNKFVFFEIKIIRRLRILNIKLVEILGYKMIQMEEDFFQNNANGVGEFELFEPERGKLFRFK